MSKRHPDAGVGVYDLFIVFHATVSGAGNAFPQLEYQLERARSIVIVCSLFVRCCPRRIDNGTGTRAVRR